MGNALQQLVSDLPEIYQMIFEHPEWNNDASRDCLPRLDIITAVYDTLAHSLGRPLRVIDFGCAQGFYSLSLAKKGASVKGVDFLPQNIAVCQALAEEHPDYDVTFEEGRIESVIDQMQDDQFDIAIGLSVFHHIVHIHGVGKVQQWVTRILERVEILLLELALKEEPLYWGPSQPDNPVALFEKNAFYQQLAEYPTHLSDIQRPLYLVSNRRVLLDDFCRPFISWDNRPHALAGEAHHGSRRYFFAEDYICKVYYATSSNNKLTEQELNRNYRELRHELKFLADVPPGFPAARLLAGGQNQWQGWSVLERLPGTLVDGKVNQLTTGERENVIYQLLQQLAALEKAGLYHDDVRTWNMLLDNNSQVYLIDYGSISSQQRDCNWPDNVFQALIITLYEILYPSGFRLPHDRPLALSALNFTEPYSNWLYAFSQQGVSAWSFDLLLDLFNRKEALPAPRETLNATDLWIAATEKWLSHSQLHANHLRTVHEQDVKLLGASLREEIDKRLSQLQQEITQEIRHSFEAMKSDPRPEVEHLTDDALADMNQEEILAGYQAAMDEMAQVREENQQLRHRVEALLNSRSWRLTAPYRYSGLQVILLRRYGLKQRIKHLLKRCAKGTFVFLDRYPGLKVRSVQLLRKSGQFERVKAIYRRVYPQPQVDVSAQYQEQKEWVLADPRHRLPPAVNTIFEKLQCK